MATAKDYLSALFDPDKSFYDTLVTTADLAKSRRAALSDTEIISSIINPLKDELLNKAAVGAALMKKSDFYTPKAGGQIFR
jgi:hypothetical protein